MPSKPHPNTYGRELIQDIKFKVLRIPASDLGNIVGYEYEVEEQPFFLQNIGSFRKRIQCWKATIPCNFPRAGSSRSPG